MIRKERAGIHWLEFELLAECKRLRHGVLLRHGGHSSGPYASLNLHYGIGDDPQNVRANLDKVSSVLEIPDLTWAHQVHGIKMNQLTKSLPKPVESCDAIATQDSYLGLMAHHADCQGAIFYDPLHHALATVHCGWRGNVQNIYAHTISGMGQMFGTKPEDLLVAISPSLGPEKGEFIHYRTELPESFWQFQVKPTYFDLWAISQWQLQECGIKESHIQIARIDTYSNPEDYFSYRRSKTRGGNATLAMLF